MSGLLDALKSIVKCSMCVKVPREGPIHQCSSGHIICLSCFFKNVKCQCGVNLKNTNRNLVAEKLLDEIPQDCINKDSGCNVELLFNKLNAHEKVCSHRSVHCPHDDCCDVIPLSKCMDHINKCHNENSKKKFGIIEMESFHQMEISAKVFKCTFEWPCLKIEYDQKHFFCHQYRDYKGVWFIWVSLLEEGKPSEFDNYICTVTIEEELPFVRDRQLIGVFNPVSLDTGVLSIEERGEGLSFTDAVARSFMNFEGEDLDEGTIQFRINIQKKRCESALKRKLSDC